jgi:hypothetical protein
MPPPRLKWYGLNGGDLNVAIDADGAVWASVRFDGGHWIVTAGAPRSEHVRPSFPDAKQYALKLAELEANTEKARGILLERNYGDAA